MFIWLWFKSILLGLVSFARLRVPSGRLLLLEPLTGGNETPWPAPDPRLCPFECPTPEWRLAESLPRDPVQYPVPGTPSLSLTQGWLSN